MSTCQSSLPLSFDPVYRGRQLLIHHETLSADEVHLTECAEAVASVCGSRMVLSHREAAKLLQLQWQQRRQGQARFLFKQPGVRAHRPLRQRQCLVLKVNLEKKKKRDAFTVPATTITTLDKQLFFLNQHKPGVMLMLFMNWKEQSIPTKCASDSSCSDKVTAQWRTCKRDRLPKHSAHS